jgi:hypothetical protein
MNIPQQEPEDYILVCVQKPTVEDPFPATRLWQTLTIEINSNPTRFAGFENLCENVWMFPEKTHRKTALDFLAYCKALGDRRMVCTAYKIHGKPEVWP